MGPVVRQPSGRIPPIVGHHQPEARARLDYEPMVLGVDLPGGAVMFLSVDPGLDEIAIAEYNWNNLRQSPSEALVAVHRITTKPTDPIRDRLYHIFTSVEPLVLAPPDMPPRGCVGVVIEKPPRGGIYRRSQREMVAVMQSMYWSNLATGALIAAFAFRGIAVELLEPPERMTKENKQQFGARILSTSGLKPTAPRRTWSDDDRDAAAIGMQVMSDPRFHHLLVRTHG